MPRDPGPKREVRPDEFEDIARSLSMQVGLLLKRANKGPSSRMCLMPQNKSAPTKQDDWVDVPNQPAQSSGQDDWVDVRPAGHAQTQQDWFAANAPPSASSTQANWFRLFDAGEVSRVGVSGAKLAPRRRRDL
jgi:hypothetical protein